MLSAAELCIICGVRHVSQAEPGLLQCDACIQRDFHGTCQLAVLCCALLCVLCCVHLLGCWELQETSASYSPSLHTPCHESVHPQACSKHTAP